MEKPVKNISHVVITPVKNEKNLIQGCINSMMSQSIPPKLWIIIDDNSTDGTDLIIKNASLKYSNIKITKSNNANYNRKRGSNIADMFLHAFELIDIEWDFCSKIDSDILLGKNYFKLIFSKFDDEPLLGIASGGCYLKKSSKLKLEKVASDHTRGALKTYRALCYNQISGIRGVDGWDGIDNIMAQMKGWKTKNYPEVKAIHLRPTGSYHGMISGCFESGKFAYFMGYHPLFIFARSLHKFLSFPYILGGISLLIGYIYSFIINKDIFDDDDTIKFLRNKQLIRMKLKKP